MAELGKIEKPEANSFKENRKLYVVPTLPFEELAQEMDIDRAKVERFWGEVREKIEYFRSTYGNISRVYVESMDEDEPKGIEFFERLGKESNHYKFLKNLTDAGAKLKGIDSITSLRRTKLLYDEYSRSFSPETEDIHKGFYVKDIDFNKWREYLVKMIQETQDGIGKHATGIIGELPENTNGVLIFTDGRPIEYPAGIDVFQIRPPAFDELAKLLRDKM
ncbi:MAG: hypothetical protein L6282_09570 [Candidatus Methanoperedenaceae archaeon]|nr:hypothetical protein [Candidatus Methanoperedenaceae archaeon]